MPKGIFSDPIGRAKKISESLKEGAFFNCLRCGKEFWRKPSAIKNGENKYCSKECYLIKQSGVPKKQMRRPPRYGAQCHNWKGGITPINKAIRGSREFACWRKSVFERDNFTCKECGARSKVGETVYLHAHHVIPFAVSPLKRFDVDNGLTLCKKCHDKKPKGKQVYCMT
jgi:5-methylcytosine-specific restriction endonuclease McrA